jgi:prepilin-type N-terminal cleavage/methylation domain-containing protein
MNRRRGISLIEMLVVISIGATLAGIAVFMLHALMKSHYNGRDHMQYSRTMNRLAEQFRADAHAMQKTSSENTDTTFTLLPGTTDGVKIRYQCLQGRIDREEVQGDKIVRQESFILPPDVEASIKITPQQDTTIAQVLISPKQQTQKLYYTAPAIIEAVLGRDIHLSKVHTIKKEEPKQEEPKEPPAEQPETEKSPAEKPATEGNP